VPAIGDTYPLGAVSASASFSDCRKYRYTLSRIWGAQGQGLLVFVMLNPSTADELTNDPTVERCQRRAILGGFGGLMVVNLFALRSTDPAALKAHPDPVGAENDHHIVQVCRIPGAVVVCGWGTHGKLKGRDRQVIHLLRQHDIPLHALKVSRDGHPWHPLYVSYDTSPQPWIPELH
jgi:hypothetical protein